MPRYEYRCENCRKKFDVVLTLAEKERGKKTACPKCGGRKVTQQFGSFFAKTSRKS